METACVQSYPSRPATSEGGNEYASTVGRLSPTLLTWHGGTFWGGSPRAVSEYLLCLVALLLSVKCEPRFEWDTI